MPPRHETVRPFVKPLVPLAHRIYYEQQKELSVDP